MVLKLLGGLGVPFLLAASVVNVAAGAASVLLVWRLLSARAGDCVLYQRMALLATMLWCLYPATTVLQIAYSEALGMALLAAFLCLLLDRRYLWCALVVLLLGFTRAAAPPLAVVVLVHLALRWRSERATGARAPLSGQRRSSAVLLVATGVSAVAWPLLVGLVTGKLDAFFLVQAAWGQKPGQGPFVAWLLWSWHALGVPGVLLLVAVVAAYVSLVVGRHGSWLAPRAAGLGPGLPAVPAGRRASDHEHVAVPHAGLPDGRDRGEHDRAGSRRAAGDPRMAPQAGAGHRGPDPGRDRVDGRAAHRHAVVGLAALIGAAQRPVKVGLSLARNAVTAAAWSSLPPVSDMNSPSRARDSVSVWPAE